MLSEHGHLVWLDLNPKEYRELDRARLFLTHSETWSMPALSRGLLYVCQNSRGVDDTFSKRMLDRRKTKFGNRQILISSPSVPQGDRI